MLRCTQFNVYVHIVCLLCTAEMIVRYSWKHMISVDRGETRTSRFCIWCSVSILHNNSIFTWNRWRAWDLNVSLTSRSNYQRQSFSKLLTWCAICCTRKQCSELSNSHSDVWLYTAISKSFRVPYFPVKKATCNISMIFPSNHPRSLPE